MAGEGGAAGEGARLPARAHILALCLALLSGSCAEDSAAELVQWLQVTAVADMDERVRSIAHGGTLNERLTVVVHLGSLHQGERNDAAAADLVALFLDDEDPEVLATAAFYVGYLGGRRHVARLATLASHPEEKVRNLAVSGVAEMAGPGDEEALHHLYPLLADPEVLVRLSAVEAIAAIGSPASVAPLLEAFASEDRLAVKHALVVTLGHLGDASALPPLRTYRQQIERMGPGRFRLGSFRGDDPSGATLRQAIDQAIARLQNAVASGPAARLDDRLDAPP